MRRKHLLIAIIILTLILAIYSFCRYANDTNYSFPIRMYAVKVDWPKLDLTKSDKVYFPPNSIEYLGEITINEDEAYTYNKEGTYTFNDDEAFGTGIRNDPYYASVVILFYKYLKWKEPCIWKTYHDFKPRVLKEEDKIFKTQENIFTRTKRYNRYTKTYWIRERKTYFPSKDFFKCLYNTGFFINPKIGKKYEKNGWVEEQKPGELSNAILKPDMARYISRSIALGFRD